MRLTLLVALVPLVLAGCLGDETPAAEPVEDAATKDKGAAASASTTAPAAAQTANDEAASIEAGPEAAPLPVPFTWEGKTGMWFCVPDSPSSCRSPPVQSPSPGDPGYDFEDVGGRIDAVTGTLTWTATTHATEELGVAYWISESCGDGCREGVGGGSVTGTSPLSFEFVGPLEEGQTVHLFVFVRQPDLPLVYHMSLEQPFTLEGVYTPTP